MDDVVAKLVGADLDLFVPAQIFVDMDETDAVNLIAIAADAAQYFKPYDNPQLFGDLKGVSGFKATAQLADFLRDFMF